jgi:hypothetical protein
MQAVAQAPQSRGEKCELVLDRGAIGDDEIVAVDYDGSRDSLVLDRVRLDPWQAAGGGL